MTLAIAGNSAGGYNINKSLRFRGNASAYMNRTPASASNRKTWTWSGWVKRGAMADGTYNQLIFSASNGSLTDTTWNNLNFNASGGINFTGPSTVFRSTTQVFRDPASWYHIVLAFDTTQATAANRIKLYVNGVQVTSFSTSNDPTLNGDYAVNQAAAHYLSGSLTTYYTYGDYYLAEVNFVDGQALTPSSFGSTNTTTGVWQPAKYTGTYGTNGFYLPFTNTTSTTTLGYDFSGNGNNWTTNNISLTSGVTYDSMNDVPTLTSTTQANYPTINPIFLGSYGGTMTPYAGNLQTGTVQANSDNNVLGTMAMPSTGKYYWEVTITGGAASPAGGNGYYLGVSDNIGQYSFGWQSKSGSPFSTTYTTNDVLGFACNKDAGTIQCFKNGVSVGTTTLDPSYVTFIFYYWGNVGTGAAIAVNFGQQPFVYSAPSGFVNLNSYNLTDSTIKAGNKYMDATTYTSTGTTQTVTNAGSFKPDLLWIKNRSIVQNNYLADSNRGVANIFNTNTSNAQSSSPNFVTGFNSNGFSFGVDNTANGNSMVGWQWQAGQGTTSTNTSGSVTSTVSVNPTAGFSIVSFTSPALGSTATVGHGLGVKPNFIMYKEYGISSDTIVYHSSIGATKYLDMTTTDAATTNANVWNNTEPTSSVFSIGTSFSGSHTTVAYCWTEIAGFSKFGSYGGTGDATYSPFQYCGFRPRYLMIKRYSTSGSWWIVLDSARSTYNVANNGLYPNTSGEENATYGAFANVDFLSNGFKIRTNDTWLNGAGATYIYAAFAENPFKNALAR